jgi:hypothetical protein
MKTINYKQMLCALFSIMLLSATSQPIGEIRGIIKDTDLQPVPFATIKIMQGVQLIAGTQTDMDGRYNYKPLVPGIYELIIIEPGHQTQPVNKVKVIPNEATYVDVKLTANTLGTVTVMAKPIDYTKTGVEKTMFNQISIDATELNRNASYSRGDVKGALETITTDVVSIGDGEVHFRGSRSDASGFFVDGVRTLNASTNPGVSIENLSVFPGGVPAMYGDLSSGVVIITTRGYFSSIREKNVRMAAKQENEEQEKAKQKAKEDEEKRAKEIEEQRAKTKEAK